MNCLHCKIDLKDNKNCPNCGYPNYGSKEEKRKYVENEIINREAFKDTIKANKDCRKILISIGSITIVISLILFIIDSSIITLYDLIVYEIIGVIFLGLWFLSKNIPYLAFSIGLFIMALDLILGFIIDPSYAIKGIYLKLIIIGSIIYGIIKGFKLFSLKKKYEFLIK